MPRQPSKRPISLANLRGFDASARHLSFTSAADELHLTQSSVSRQVASLEDELGQSLFLRKTRALELTTAGYRLARAVRLALEGVDDCVADLRSGQSRSRVNVTTFPSFASLWLIPRLPEFARIAPGLDLRIDSTETIVDLAAEQFDVAIRLLHQDKAPRAAVKLVGEEYTPVISPALLASVGPLKAPADLARATMLVMEDTGQSSRERNWEHWFEAVGAKPVKGQARLIFNFTDQTLQAAARGQGVALGRRPFLDDFVARGELVTPFATRLASPYGYFLIVNPASADAPHVKAFCDWLRGSFNKLLSVPPSAG